MKILILDQWRNPQKKLTFAGGLEKVSRNQARLISKLGHDVHYVTHPLSDDLSGEGFTQWRYPNEILQRNKKTVSVRAAVDIFIAKNGAPDVIFNHIDPPSAAKGFLDLGIPVVGFIHQLYGAIGMIGLQSWQACREMKASYPNYMLAAVGDFQVEYYKKWKPSEGKDYFDFVVSNFVIDFELPKVEAPSFGGCYIGRPVRSKNVHKIVEMLTVRNETGRFFVNPSFIDQESDDAEYWSKIVSTIPSTITVHENLPHPEIMKNLSFASYIVISHVLECASIAAFEAICRGIPAVFYTAGDDPAHTVPYIYDFFSCQNVKLKDHKYEFKVDLSLACREEIQRRAKERFSIERWSASLEKTLAEAAKRKVISKRSVFF